ncbi:MAG TPA: histidinol-phosphate transaminase [Thiotrichales bacterium]|nr:histidinol-phosphate transaminase [Thiotrichales bacterium]
MSARRTPAELVRPAIRRLSAYRVPDPGDALKLDAMENPYGWPESMRTAWLERLRDVPLNRYPDPAARRLGEAIRRHVGLPEEMGLLLGNGSDELIQMILMTVAGEGRRVLAPEPTFVMYRMIAEVLGLDYRGVPLGEDFALDAEAMLAAIRAHDPEVVFLAYPNNPTGNLFEREAVEAILDTATGLVVVDEAYSAFASDSFLPALGRWPNLLVMRTLSKTGLAGLRLGMLMGPPEWLGEIDKTRLPYNINVLTQVSATFALEHAEVLEAQCARIRDDRAVLFERLEAMEGVHPWPSEANFILFRVPQGQGRAVFEGLKARGVLVKAFGDTGPLADCLRVTVGTPEENARFLEALAETLEGEKPEAGR